MITEALWARAEEHRQLCALREKLARQEIPQAGETTVWELRRSGTPPAGSPLFFHRTFVRNSRR